MKTKNNWACTVRCTINKDLEQNRMTTPKSGGKKNIPNPHILLFKHITFSLVILYVSIFTEIPLTSVSPPE